MIPCRPTCLPICCESIGRFKVEFLHAVHTQKLLHICPNQKSFFGSDTFLVKILTCYFTFTYLFYLSCFIIIFLILVFGYNVNIKHISTNRLDPLTAIHQIYTQKSLITVVTQFLSDVHHSQSHKTDAIID